MKAKARDGHATIMCNLYLHLFYGVIGRAQRARTSELNGNFVCMYVYMSSTVRGQCACIPTQCANVAGLASSAHCARPQMLCILLVYVMMVASPSLAFAFAFMLLLISHGIITGFACLYCILFLYFLALSSLHSSIF